MTTVGENQNFEITQDNTETQESSNYITKDQWLNEMKEYNYDATKKSKIERVPSMLRKTKSNINSYVPLVVSIGPYHHGNKDLEAFEKLKTPIAQKFCHEYCINQVSIEELYEEVAKEGKTARELYETGSTDTINDELFNRMMFLDACFVLYFMFILREQKEVGPLQDRRCYFAFVRRDLFLLENQIPLLVLNALMIFCFKSESERIEFIQNFLDQKEIIIPPQENTRTNAFEKSPARMSRSGEQKKDEWVIDLNASPPHLLHLAREHLIWSSHSKGEKKKKPELRYRSVTELKSAGIHFRPSQTKHITDVKFSHHHISSTLTLPPMMVDDSTKPFFLNLVAYEMSLYSPSDYGIMSYIWLMDSLIDDANDVKELRKKGIVVNNLGSDEHLAKLFNEIANDLVPDPHAYAYVMEQIDNHCKDKGNVWMAEWMRNHVRSPWTLLAMIVAIYVVVLTTVQTCFAIFPH